jgi:hypothetical protein
MELSSPVCALAGPLLARNVPPPSQEDTSSSNLIVKFPGIPANTNTLAPPPCSTLYISSHLRCPRHGGPQEEGPIRGRCIRVWSQLQRPSWCRNPASCPRLWCARSTWIWGTRCACVWGPFASIWSASASLWRTGTRLRTAPSTRPKCARPAVRADELGASAGTSCTTDTAAHGGHAAKPIVSLRPHRPAVPRVGALQSPTAHQSALKRGRYALRVRQRVEQIPAVHPEHDSHNPLAAEEVKGMLKSYIWPTRLTSS